MIAPGELDIQYLKKFRSAIVARAKKGQRFFIITGGGQTCRIYQKAAQAIGKISNDDLDWIGIATNKLHSEFVRAIFGKLAYKEVLGLEHAYKFKSREAITVCRGGLAPGGTSDSASVKFGKVLGIKTIINLTNVAGVYDRNPGKFKNTKLIPEMSWTDLRKQFGVKKTPGRNLPFDSSIAREAERSGLKVIILNGSNLQNLQNFLASKLFKGTVVQ